MTLRPITPGDRNSATNGTTDYRWIPDDPEYKVHKRMDRMSPGERIRFISKLMEGYCRICGEAVKDVCHCDNDE